MTAAPDDAFEAARLRARVRALEQALARRSRELRAIQRTVCPRDLLVVARVTAGLPPLTSGPYDIESWNETSELLPADVEETLGQMWDSVQPTWS